MLICGIDEAGRGPVIGPLVIAGAMGDDKQIAELKEMGVKDSKLLSPIQIERMSERIKIILTDYRIVVIEPVEIDDAVSEENAASNLNWLEADKTVQIINELKPDRAIVDCPSTVPQKYSSYLRDRLEVKPELICEHKADLNHVIVGAASILAKSTREYLIQELQKKHNVFFGSGYPSDPKTQVFLEKNWDKYDFFRKTWDGYKRLAKMKGQTKLL